MSSERYDEAVREQKKAERKKAGAKAGYDPCDRSGGDRSCSCGSVFHDKR